MEIRGAESPQTVLSHGRNIYRLTKLPPKTAKIKQSQTSIKQIHKMNLESFQNLIENQCKINVGNMISNKDKP